MSKPPIHIGPVPESQTIERLVEWVIETCLLFGATLPTALIVAWHFAGDPKIQRAFS